MSGLIIVVADKALDRLPICALAVPLLASLREVADLYHCLFCVYGICLYF